MADTAAKQSLGLRDLTDASKLATKRAELKAQRQEDLREWALNREFYRGNQWAYWNKNWPNGGRVETLTVDNGDSPRYKVRLVSNQIQPGVNHWVAQMTKTKPIITAVPDSGADRDRLAAEAAQAFFEHSWREFHLGSKLQSGLTNAALSQGFLWVDWDPFASKSMQLMIDPNTGQVVTDPELADAYRDELMAVSQQRGLDPRGVLSKFERTVYMGDICVEVVPGENVLLLDQGCGTFQDVKAAIVTRALSVDDIQARFKKTVTADSAAGDDQVALQFRRVQGDNRPKDTRKVFFLYIAPCPAVPQGREVAWIEGPNEIFYDKKWDKPFRELPLVKLPGVERPNSALDIPLVTSARPLNKELNKTLSQVVEHKNLTLKPQMLAPVGSLRQRLTSEPGAVFEFAPIAGQVPQWRDMPNLPAYVFEHLGIIKQEIDRIFNRMPTQRDQLPARIDAPGSIDLLQEAVADQMLPQIRRLEEAIERLGMLMAKLAQRYYIEPRLIKIIGAGGSVRARKFMGTDLDGGFSFHAEAGSGLPRTRAGKQARIEFLLENHLIDPQTALRHLDVADMTGITTRMAADEDQAYREHEKLINGEPISAVAVADAMQIVQQAMMDPEADPDGDGMPDPPYEKAQWAQMQIKQAAIMPLPFENSQAHLDAHQAYMTSPEFENLPLDTQQRFWQHYQMTFDRVIQLRLMVPGEAPRIALQMKATTSAPVAGEILRRSGIQVSDDDVAQPPLDTWVTDDVTKPAAQETGNTHLTGAEQIQSMQQAEEQHALTTAKAAHQVSLAQAQANAAHQQNAMAMEKHDQAMQHAAQQHQAKMKQSGQGSGGRA